MPAGWESKSLKESRTKIVETIKSKVHGANYVGGISIKPKPVFKESKAEDHAQNIAGIEGDSDRVTGEAGLQIARMKYLSNY